MKVRDILIFIALIIVIVLVFVGIKYLGLTTYTPPEEEFLGDSSEDSIVVADADDVTIVNETEEPAVKPEEPTAENTVEPEVITPEPEQPTTGKQDQFAGNTDHGINAIVSIDQKMNYNGREIYYYKNYRDNYVLTIKNGDAVDEIAEVMEAAFTERVGNTLYYFKDMDGKCTFYSYDLVKKEEKNLEIPIDVKVVGMNSYDQKVLLKVENYSEVEGGNALIEYEIRDNSYGLVNN